MRRLLLAFITFLLASAVVMPAPVGAVEPDAPQNVAASLVGGDVEVTWDAPASDGGSPITGYVVRVNGGAAEVVAVTPEEFTVSSPAPGSSVTVAVAARNADGDSAEVVSNTVVVPPVAPSNATISLDQVTSSSMRATFSANAGGGSNTYTLTVRTGSAAGPVVQGPDPATSPATISGLSANTEYFVTVSASNGVGSPATATANSTTAFGSAGAPVGVVASLSGINDANVTVAWQAPANTGGGLGNYTIRLSNGQTLTAPNTATSVAFTNVPPGSTVTATVQSSNGAGTPGATSATSNSVTTPNVPGPITGLSAAWAGASNINSINVSWNAPASNGGLAISGYGVSVSPALANPIPDVAANATSLTIGGLEQGTAYTITIVAKNAVGSSTGVSSGAVLVPTTPGTVTNLVVQQSPPFSSTVVLTWDLPADTGGAPITGFSVVVDDRTPLLVGADVTTARFTGLPVGDHNATVRAITAAGLGATVTSPNFEVKAFPPFDSEEAFVTQLYADFLRRSPDAAGLAFWTARVADNGSNVQDIVEAFMRSPEFAPRRAVARLYFAYFNRQPDKAGFDFWTRQIASGAANLERASQSFALSPEFQRTYGSLTDAEFVVLVYNNVLSRRPDQGGFVYWLDRLNDGLPRGTMMTLFSESPENIARSRAAVDVTVTYDGMLQRAPEVAGFLFWTGRVSQTNEGLTQLIREFYFSPEYAQRVNR